MTAIIEANPIKSISFEPPQKGDSCLLVIFGASGDLARRKLIPSLYNLACVGCMNPEFDVLGTGRTPISDEEFRSRMKDAVAQSSDAHDYDESHWPDFAGRLHYFTGDFTKPGFYAKLGEKLTLPKGWQFRTRDLSEDLVLDLKSDQTIYAIGDEYHQYWTRIPKATGTTTAN